MMLWRVALVLSVSAGLAGCLSTTGPEQQSGEGPRFFLEAEPGERATPVRLPQSGVQLAIAPRPIATEYDLVAVDVVELEMGRALRFRFTPAAAAALNRVSLAYAGRRLVLRLDGETLGVRVLGGSLDHELVMLLESTDAELPAIVARIRDALQSLQQRLASD